MDYLKAKNATVVRICECPEPVYDYVEKGYEGYDPERNTFDSGTNYYPTPRIFTFGINLNF